MRKINLNRNKIYLSIKKDGFITIDNKYLNDEFNFYSNVLNEIRGNINSILDTGFTYVSKGDTEKFFINQKDGKVVQKNINNSLIENIDITKFTNPQSPFLSIVETIGSNYQTTSISDLSCFFSKNNELTFKKIEESDLMGTLFSGDIFIDKSIAQSRFDFNFVEYATFEDRHAIDAVLNYDIINNKLQTLNKFWYGGAFGQTRQDISIFDNVTLSNVDTVSYYSQFFLHLCITPKAIGNNAIKNSGGVFFSPFWSVLLKTKNKAMSDLFLWENMGHGGIRNWVQQQNNLNLRLPWYLFEYMENQEFDYWKNLKFEYGGSIDDNTFTYDLFTFYSDNIYQRYAGYIGPLYLTPQKLTADFKISKRMIYEARYADNTVQKRLPPIQKESCPLAIVRLLETNFGVIDSDWVDD